MRLASLKQFREQKHKQGFSTYPFKYSTQVIGVNFTKIKRDINGSFDDTVADTPLQKKITGDGYNPIFDCFLALTMIERYNCLFSAVSSSPISLINLNPLDPASPLGFGIAVISAR